MLFAVGETTEREIDEWVQREKDRRLANYIRLKNSEYRAARESALPVAQGNDEEMKAFLDVWMSDSEGTYKVRNFTLGRPVTSLIRSIAGLRSFRVGRRFNLGHVRDPWLPCEDTLIRRWSLRTLGRKATKKGCTGA